MFYGDKSNWWACYAFWTFKLFGHQDCRVMDGGRAKWEAEGRPLTTDVPAFDSTVYDAGEMDTSIRALRDEVRAHQAEGRPLVDVRSPAEFIGEVTHAPGNPNSEAAMRGGHIPGASNVPWSRAANDDGTFRSRDELATIYLEEQGLDPADKTIAYCRIGERSSHTWFVLRYLLGFEDVTNYDGVVDGVGQPRGRADRKRRARAVGYGLQRDAVDMDLPSSRPERSGVEGSRRLAPPR